MWQDNKIVVPKIRVPRIITRERFAPPPMATAALRSQWMRWEVVENDGHVSRGGEQHNLILTQAGDLVTTASFANLASYAVVGTAASTPAVTDTGLSEVARTNADPGGSSGPTRTADGVYTRTIVRQFPAGGGISTQNLTEWGYSPSGTAVTGNIITRGLFRDTSGTAIVITPTATQALRLTYTYTITLGPVTPTAFTAWTISGLPTITGKLVLLGQGKLDLGVFQNILTGGSGPAWQIFLGTAQRTSSYASTDAAYDGVSIPSQAYVSGSNTRLLAPTTISLGAYNGSWAGYGIGGLDGNQWKSGLNGDFDLATFFAKDSLHEVQNIVLGGFSWTVG